MRLTTSSLLGAATVLALLGATACGGTDLDFLGPTGDDDLGGGDAPASGDTGDTTPADTGPLPPAPVLTSSSGLGTHVRQGGHIVFTFAGANLDTVTSGTLGTYPIGLTTQSATSLTVSADVGHGAPLSADFASLELTLIAPGGNLTEQAAALVVGIYSGPSGDDAAAGTDVDPFRSVSHALSVASATAIPSPSPQASTTRDQRRGLADRLSHPRATSPRACDLIGADPSAGTTALRSTAAADNIGLLIDDGENTTRLYNLDLSGFAHGIVSRSSTELHTVTSHDNSVNGIDVLVGTFYCAPCRASANGAAGMSLTTTAQLSFDSIELDHNGTGLRIASSTASGRAVNIHDNGLTPVGADYTTIGPTLRSGVYMDGGRFDAESGTIGSNAVAGITAIGAKVNLGALIVQNNGGPSLTAG